MQCVAFKKNMSEKVPRMTMTRFIGLKLQKSDSESMRNNFHTEILWDVMESALKKGLTIPLSIQDLGQNLMQLLM